jgi:K+-sensing histidine kinase KdpD
MDRNEAIVALGDTSQEVRLQGARYFSSHANADDEELLNRFLLKESVPWIKRAIETALRRIEHTVEQKKEPEEPANEAASEQALRSIRADAVDEVTRTIIHEFGPLVGSLKLSAAREVDDYEQSRTKHIVEQFGALISAIRNLKDAASSPAYRNFDLSHLVSECVAVLSAHPLHSAIRVAGVRPYLIDADRDLLSLAINNGIRNSIEAVADFSQTDPPEILINWGPGGAESWLAIIDSGPGFTGKTEDAMALGNTNKQDHFGYGLTIAQLAIRSMEGELYISNKREGGARFELRWYRHNANTTN